jgi:hypothetical protein
MNSVQLIMNTIIRVKRGRSEKIFYKKKRRD